MGQLGGRNAIVARSDSDIGQGIAEELAREGADIAEISDDADDVTGQSFRRDGGLTINWGQDA